MMLHDQTEMGATCQRWLLGLKGGQQTAGGVVFGQERVGVLGCVATGRIAGYHLCIQVPLHMSEISPVHGLIIEHLALGFH